jgi:FKBP-type peptidyl-prolyl cis-trans isomerase (trigger factor)
MDETKNYTNLKIKTLENSEIEIEAEISEEFVSKYKARAIKTLSRNVKIDGFRDGHIPENILTDRIGEQAVLEEQTGMALADVYPNIVQNEKLYVIGRPEVIITKLAPKNPIGFSIKTAVMPEIKLPNYKKIAGNVALDKSFDNSNKEKQITAREKRRAEIVENIIKESKIALPKIFVESELDKMLAQFKDDIARMKISFGEYLAKIKKNENDLRIEWKLDAEKRAKLQLILNKIAIEEKIKIPEEDIKRETDHILELYKDAKPENVRVYIESVLTNEKVFEFLESQK